MVFWAVPPLERLSEGWLREQARRLALFPLPDRLVVLEDTTNYMAIDRDQVVILAGTPFLVRGNEREGRFGIDDQPKFWVKRAVNLETGNLHILKLVFQEEFRAQIGSLRVRCVRSPEKEGRVLELVRGDSRFMQGHTVCDVRGNLVRVIEHIAGANLLTHVHSLPANHREYFQAYFPAILASVIDSFRAIQLLHEAGLCHGDIRNDHLLVEKATGRFRWIDFDLDQEFADFDIWSAGNILHYIVGRGFVTFRETIKVSSGLKGNLTDDDASVFFPHRVMNLRKVHPHVPSNLNEVLMRFSAGAQVFYDKMSQLVDDLAACVETLRSLPAVPPQPAAG